MTFFKKNIALISVITIAVGGLIANKLYQKNNSPVFQHSLWPSKHFPQTVSFFKSMGDRKLVFNVHSPDDKKWYEFFHELYTKNALECQNPSQTPLIPKKIHQIWIGSPVPEHFKLLNTTWKQHHPDWEYKLWTDQDVKNIDLDINQRQFDLAHNYGQKADILRLYLLDHYGGVYVDMDFLCVLPLDILHHCYDFYTGISNAGDVELCNALMGAKPGHPIIKRYRERISQVPDQKIQSKRFGDTISSTGPAQFTRAFIDVAPTYKGPIIALPCSFFYPLPNTHRAKSFEQVKQFIKPESFAMHFWACSWLKPEGVVKRVS